MKTRMTTYRRRLLGRQGPITRSWRRCVRMRALDSGDLLQARHTSRSMPFDMLTTQAAVCSADAYVEPVKDGSTLISDAMTDAQAVVTFGSEDDAVPSATVAFRGSSSRADWYTNLWFPLKPLPSPHRRGVKAHAGFLRQYLAVHAHIQLELERGGVQHVVLTGHSLGGALAVIAAAMLPSKYTYDVVTFGAPRAGNEELSSAAYHKCKSAIRVVHDRDVVPCVPLQTMGFRHVCEPWVLLDADGNTEVKDKQLSFWQQCALRARGLFERDYGIRDHFMSKYMRGVPQDEVREERRRELEMQSFPMDSVEALPSTSTER